MMLKAYRCSGPATFEIKPIVWIRIQDTKDTIAHPDSSITYRFFKFMEERDIYTSIRAGSSGGGAFYGGFDPEHADAIRTWLLENGAVEGPAPEDDD